MVIVFYFYIFIFISLPRQNNSTALSATFDNSESLKHSRHFETNKLEINCGRQGPALPFPPPNSAGCISTLVKRLDLLLAALKMGKGEKNRDLSSLPKGENNRGVSSLPVRGLHSGHF